MFQLRGKLIVKNDEQVISEKFKKREFVIQDEDEKYPQVISFQLVQDKCSLLDAYNVNDTVTVYFNLRGREWTSPKDGQVKYFNTLEAWKLSAEGAAPVQVPAAASVSGSVDTEDELPF